MQRKGVTLMLLWHEYRASLPEGYSYQAFTEHYRLYRRRLGLVMRQTHKAGERLYVDYSGLTVPFVDAKTGNVYKAEIFIGIMVGRISLPVRLVVLTAFEKGRRFRPKRLTPAGGTLGLLEHTLPARARPRASCCLGRGAPAVRSPP